MEAGLFLFKALSNLSLVFMICNFIFGIISKVPSWHLLLFLGANLLSLVVYYTKKRGLRKFPFLLLSLVPPALALLSLVFVPLKDIVYSYVAYALINYTLAIYVGWSGIKPKRDYGLVAETFGKGFGLVVIIIFLMLLQDNTNLMGTNFGFYILIFLLSSIYLLRTLRYLQYNDDERELRKINLSYSLFVLIAAFVLGSAAVRGFLGYLLGRVYVGLVWFMVYLLFWLALPVIYLIKLLAHGLNVPAWKGLQTFSGVHGPLNQVKSAGGANPVLFRELQSVLRVPIKILLILLLFYGLLKLLQRFNDFGRETEEYRESRESIWSLGERTSLLPKISGIFQSRNGVETIRHYYQRFLRLSLKREINILHSDTTLEINKKGEQHFDKDVLEVIRSIYIQVRYGGKPCGEETVQKFRDLLKRLVQGSRAK